tara:strand:- start:128 stop:388 length:261 start_codon:yes stop_codon:yes gene_type:complete
MKVIIKKDSLLYDLLEEDEKDLKYDILDMVVFGKEGIYYVLESLTDNYELIIKNALPEEVEEVKLTFGESILEEVKEEVNLLLETL